MLLSVTGCCAAFAASCMMHTRLVEGNVAVMADTSEEQLYAAVGLDALLVAAVQ